MERDAQVSPANRNKRETYFKHRARAKRRLEEAVG
jgi:hypothetical protein